MKIKLHWRLTFIFCLVVILALSSGYFYLISHLKSYIERNIENNIRNQLVLGKDFVETQLKDKKASMDFQVLASRIGSDLGLRATIIGIDGKVLGDTDLTDEQLVKIENHAGRPEIKEALKSGLGISKRFSYTVNKDMLYIAAAFGKEKPEGVLRFSVPLSDIDILQAGMHRVVGVSIIGILLLSLVLTFLVSLFVSRPLSEMSMIAKFMAAGDFSKKAPVYYADEIRELAQSLNLMSEEIKDKIEKLNSERAKLDLVLSSMFEGVIVTDENENIILMNPSLRRIFLVESEPEGKKPIEVIRNTAVQDMIDRILKGKQHLATEEILVTMPEERILRVNGVPILRNDKFEGAILVFHDITELRRLEQIRQDFVANVSHELRTPISSIKGYAETLLEGALKDKHNAKDFINIIYQDAERLSQLINDLLDLSRIESGKMKMNVVELDPVSVIKRAMTVIDNQAKVKSIALKLDFAPELPDIKADETRLSQVLINLLDNAIKYTPENGSVTISAAVSADALQIDVSDTGIGISDKDLPRIFERFYRVDKARSRELGGTGLGLSIVKHIVQAHGGQVWVKSEPGLGSTFSFTIPLSIKSS
ncbi:MAG: ATP-binding protein [Candidatus Omnitrophica bacterium]|nr:ATP-binding protein [Candidatus Omnitrophota bacterium]